MKIAILLLTITLSACGTEKALSEFAEKCTKDDGKVSIGMSHNGVTGSVIVMCERKE